MTALLMYSKMLCNMMTVLLFIIRWVSGELGKLIFFYIYSFPLFVSVSTFITEASGGHDILELSLRKIFCLYENIHCNSFCQSAKLKGIVADKGGWLPKILKLSGQPSLVNRYLRVCATNCW